MCGIAGWVDYDRDLNEQKPFIEAMTRTMALRGPDAQGIWIDRHAALGHRRLSVIDLEGGAQPMQAAEEGKSIACLTYSGEVYNFVKLRDELRKHGDCVCRLRETVIGHEPPVEVGWPPSGDALRPDAGHLSKLLSHYSSNE
ncbi:hypothetical protein [Paraburkholderia sp. 35.1]|uniref:hypothetical protein n=1 Tax=Paraburkholderia sp. 35.1 TaxID=2991058 RepID=UPI003D1DB96B